MSEKQPLAPVVPMRWRGGGRGDEVGLAGRELSAAILAFVLRCKQVGDIPAEQREPASVREVRYLALHLVEVCDRWQHISSSDVLRDAIEGGRCLASAFLRDCEVEG
jgi:hypothetical protein